MPASAPEPYRNISSQLIVHNRAAYQLFEDLATNNIIKERHLCLLRRIVYDCKGESSCTTPQAVLARRTKRPKERVKRHLREVERTGWIRHQREGNTWRTIVTAFLPLDQALEAIADAHGCDAVEARRYLEHLQKQGIRLPWDLAETQEEANAAACSVEDPEALIAAAQAARAAGEFQHCADLLRQAASIVEQCHATPLASASFFDAKAGGKTAALQNAQTYPATQSDTTLMSRNHDLESFDPPLPPRGKRAGKIHDTEVTRLLVAEDVFTVEEFAAMPLQDVQAVLACDDIANAKDEFRPHRIVKRLRLAQHGLWTPPVQARNNTPRWAKACPRCAHYIAIDLADVGRCRRCGWRPASPADDTISMKETVGQTESSQDHAMEIAQGPALSSIGSSTYDLCEVWRAVQQKLAATIPSDISSTWLEPCRLVAIDTTDGQLEAMVGAPNVFVRDEIVVYYRNQLERCFSDLLGQSTHVHMVIDSGDATLAARAHAR